MYTEFPTTYSLRFVSYRIVKVGDTAIGVNINAEQSGSLTRFDNRRGTVVDITKTTSIGGFTIDDYADLLKRLQIPIISAFEKAIYSDSTSQQYTNSTPDDTAIVYIPQTIVSSDFSESKSIALGSTATMEHFYGLYYEGDENRVLMATGTIVLTINNIAAVGDEVIIKVDVVNSNETIDHTYTLATYTRLDSGEKTLVVSQSLTVDATQSVVIYADVTVGPVGGDLDINFDSSDILLAETVILTAATTIDAFPIYETGERLAQHMMDTQFPFYSEYLGRDDTAYNLNGDFYATENQLRFMSFTSGLAIRGELITEDNNPISLSWDKWFQAVTSMYNLGYTFETIDSFLRIRVEEYAFFFEDVEVLDISGRISSYDIETEAMPELAYLNIKSGYKSFDYEAVNEGANIIL